MPNPFALGRSGGYDYGVPADQPEYAASATEFTTPATEAPMVDNPAGAGAALAVSGHASVYGLPVAGPSYVARSLESGGSAATYRPSTTGVFAAQRLETIPRYDHRPDAGEPPSQLWGDDGLAGTPSKERSVAGGEDLTGTGRPMEPHPYSPGQRRWVDNPRRDPVPSLRPRGLESPDGWRFLRPFDQMNRPTEHEAHGTSRRLTGQHFSMADHRRTFEVNGMVPQGTRRNTYRVEPGPWDADRIDAVPPVAEASVHSIDIPAPKSWRL